MSTRSLPLRPSLDQLKIQANELHRAHRERQPSAAARIVAHHPEMKSLALQAVLDRPLALADAQLVLAREYGFANWAQLKHRVELASRLDAITPHPRFDDALAALDAGDLERLRGLLVSDPTLVQARTNLEPPYGYFTGATLLHHVAGNPGRDNSLPRNIVAIARLLLEAGADVNARTLGRNGGDTMGLLTTSKQASDADLTGPVMDVLLEYGAKLDLKSDGCLDGSLANHAPRAAEKMLELGAKPDIFAAAALGRMDLLRGFFDSEGRLQSRPRRHGKEMNDRDSIGLALLYAYVRHQREAVDFLLEKDGNWNMTGVNNGTALHRAAWGGDLDMVQRLVAKGADMSDRNNPFNSTPLSWAQHNKRDEVFHWMRTHCAIDLHEAVCFDLREHVEARLSEDPASVNKRLDQWDIPQCTPLHWAAWLTYEDVDGVHSHDPLIREQLVKLLLDRGADPNIVAGNGLTPLDIAHEAGAAGIVALLEQHGGKRADATQTRTPHTLEPYEKLARDIVEAYRSGESGALKRVQDFFKRGVTLHEIRNGVQRRLQKPKDADISLADAQDVVAGLRGFGSWAEFARSVTRPNDRAKSWALPLYRIDEKHHKLQVRDSLDETEWDAIIAVMAEKKIPGLDANGQMADGLLERIAQLDHVTRLELRGSKELTDAGLRHLARLPQLRHLDLSGTQVTDRGLEVLRQLPELRTIHLYWHRTVTDAGVAHLSDCHHLERVALMGTPTGDGALRALAGKPHLRHLQAGTGVTEAGLALLHEFPVFKTWQGGAITYGLMEYEAGPNYLQLNSSAPFASRAAAKLVGLDGLFALNLDNPAWKGVDLQPLTQLPNLGWLGHDADDESMRQIGGLPRLRVLMAQDTVAGDDGFTALSRSATIEYIWGRRCYNLTGRGFTALSTMPALRGLSVSCKNVDDAALSTLPDFPALTEFMPMDVRDAGFRHVGRCTELEALWCMYCRETTDAATEHIAGLSQLKTYYAGQTKITDRSLEILSRMPSLETLTFWNTAGITNAGVAVLATLPRLREITLESCRQVTAEAAAVLPAHVRVTYSA